MRLYNLGSASWEDVQAIACALAGLGQQGAVLAETRSSCVCAGGQVNLEQEVDLEFCRAHAIPVFRRETRSHTLCLAERQLELQVIAARDHPLLSTLPSENGRLILTPFLHACRALGLDATYKSPAEIVVGDRRIASACFGQVHDHVVLAASLILEFNPDLFIRVLKTLDAELRARVAELVHQRRTSLKEELGDVPLAPIENYVVEELAARVGPLQAAERDAALCALMRDNATAMFECTRSRTQERMANGWRLEVGAGTELTRCAYKAPGGFLRATCEWSNGRIVRAYLSGDFFSFPPGALFQLEQALVGVRQDQVERKLNELYGRLRLVTPGVQAAHWAHVLNQRN